MDSHINPDSDSDSVPDLGNQTLTLNLTLMLTLAPILILIL